MERQNSPSGRGLANGSIRPASKVKQCEKLIWWMISMQSVRFLWYKATALSDLCGKENGLGQC